MPDENSEVQEVKILPGQLAPFDYSPHEPAKLTEEEQNCMTELVRKAGVRDQASRRFMVEQTWEARLFGRGYQHLLPRKGGGWVLPQESTGYGVRTQAIASLLPTNIYSPYEQILVSALTRSIPKIKWQPQDPENDKDITAAESAEPYEKVFRRVNDLPTMHTDMARYLCDDGAAYIYTRHVIDAQRFGYEEPDADDAVVPEDESQAAPDAAQGAAGDTDQTAGETANTEIPGMGSGAADSGADTSTGKQGTGSEDRPSDASALGEGDTGGDEQGATPKTPRGQEVSDVYGKLECKLPMNTKNLSECHFFKLSLEYDKARVMAMFPDMADKIQVGSGPGENELDRIARINVALALAASYVTGDAMVNDVTVDRTWFRPAAFMGIDDKSIRNSLLSKFPDGCLVVHAGKTFAFARPENMDDHWAMVKASRSDGQNCASLMAWMIPNQKRVNNWVDLLNDFFIRTIPKRYLNSEVFNIEAIRQQAQVPGDVLPFSNPGAMTRDQLMIQEDMPTHQPELPNFIKEFIGELAQLQTGGYPALSGGDTKGNDTLGGIAMQRDQALGRLGAVWHDIQGATATYHKQAVQCAAKCRQGNNIKESVPGSDAVTIELSDLKGNVLCFPEADSSFPESWGERQQRFTAIVAEAKENPIIGQLLQLPKNLKLAKDSIGLSEFDIPQSDAEDKQLGEFEILLKTQPLPNPLIAKAQETLQAMTQNGAMPEQIQQLQQAMGQVPPLVSSVQVDQECDDHDTEAQTCLTFINGPKGRKLKAGTPEEKAGFQNIRLHYLEHKKLADAKKQQMLQAAQRQKVSESLNFKDAPPELQVQIAADAGHQMAQPAPQPVNSGADNGH